LLVQCLSSLTYDILKAWIFLKCVGNQILLSRCTMTGQQICQSKAEFTKEDPRCGHLFFRAKAPRR
jgi:hypothetical protein